MQLNFAPLTIEHLEPLSKLVPAHGTGDCNLSLVSLLAYAEKKEISIAFIGSDAILYWKPETYCTKKAYTLLGNHCLSCSIKALEKHCQDETLPLYGVFPKLTDDIIQWSHYRCFDMNTDSAGWDYLYDKSTMCELLGRKLHGKRNFVKRFWAAFPEAKLLPINQETIGLCRTFLGQWYANYDKMDESLVAESQAINFAFDHFEALNLKGALLVNDTTVLGFTYGSTVAPGIFAVHIEKASRDAIGSYPALTQAFAQTLPNEIHTINREEDLGIAGLRKAKQDWSPSGMVRKGFLTLHPEQKL